jgi:hypothetical protein
MGFDKLHQQSMEANNLDSIYCNLNLVMETLAFYRTSLKELRFSNVGIEKVKDELIHAYDKYKSGDRQVLKSELELKEKVGDYIKWVIDDAKSGNQNYEDKNNGIFNPNKPSLLKRKN